MSLEGRLSGRPFWVKNTRGCRERGWSPDDATDEQTPSPKTRLPGSGTAAEGDGRARRVRIRALRRFETLRLPRSPEGPLLSAAHAHREPGHLAILATRPGAAKSPRLREWARELCGKGVAVLAVGASVGPVAELFGSPRPAPTREPGERTLGRRSLLERRPVHRVCLPSCDWRCPQVIATSTAISARGVQHDGMEP